MLKILHFADAHIDMANYGRHDAESGLPLRVIDFLKSLDTIIDTAIDEKVDLVIFAGDAYKDRNPAPTFQREWGRRIIRLSKAGIPTILLVGNHDLSPALGRAHAIQEFNTLEVPHVHVISKPTFLRPEDIGGLPLQILALPWISRSGLLAHLGYQAGSAQKAGQVYEELEIRLTELIHGWIEQIDPALPAIFTAHASIQGAVYGAERTVMLGSDLVLPGSLVRDSHFDYVALGHIHKPQDLNDGAHPPIIYPGSIERIDFGEAADDKFFVIANVARGNTEVEWRQLTGIRSFIDRSIILDTKEGIDRRLREALPAVDQLQGAIVRLVIEYPRDWEPLIDDASLREYAQGAFEFHLVKRPQVEARVRLPEDHTLGSMSALELLDLYWRASHTKKKDMEKLKQMASEVIADVRGRIENE
ncbi:MAG: exonuclease SbcCD subunit D [Chloroflexota bacterium]|nr:MAG: exonuclease SbcCD subunit D [Chloroflexota bacterium]